MRDMAAFVGWVLLVAILIPVVVLLMIVEVGILAAWLQRLIGG